MSLNIIDLTLQSEHRTKILLLLHKESITLDKLVELSELETEKLLMELGLLKENHLVMEEDGSYKLTTIGKIVIDRLIPLLDGISLLERYIYIAEAHGKDSSYLRMFQDMLPNEKCDTIVLPISKTSEVLAQIHEASFRSRVLYAVNTHFHPHPELLLPKLVDKGVHVRMVVSSRVLNELAGHQLSTLKDLVSNKRIHLYINHEKDARVSFAYNDSYLVANVDESIGESVKKYIVCSNQLAIKFAKILFDEYMKDSKQVLSI